MHRFDYQLKESHRRIRTAVVASATTLTELFGLGPIIACSLIGFTGDIAHFANHDAYSAYNGTAPVERSSRGRIVHSVSQRSNRRLNRLSAFRGADGSFAWRGSSCHEQR